MQGIVYRMCKSFFLTKGMVDRIEHRVSLIYPATRYAIIKRTQIHLVKLIIIAIASGLSLLIFSELSLYYGVMVTVIVYAIMNNYTNNALSKQELKLLVSFEQFISEVHFNYQFSGVLLEAIEQAGGKVSYEMGLHAQLIHTYLKKAYLGKGDDYREIVPNNLFLTFYSLSLTVLEYGDRQVENGSLYLRNLGYLKEDVNAEILKRKKLDSKFMGLSMVTILPVFSIKIIEKWALSNMPELAKTYEGFFGILSTIVIALVTVLIYKTISQLKNTYKAREVKSMWSAKLLEFEIINRAIIFYLNSTYKKSNKLNELLRAVVYPYDIKEFYIRRFVFSFGMLPIVFLVLKSIGLSFELSIVSAVVAMIIFYNAVVLKLYIKKGIMIMDSEEEIVRFQSVILMLMHMDKVTVDEILQHISEFAVTFKPEIDRMIDKFSYIGIRVFEDAKEYTGFAPFKKLMDSFMATDLLGVKLAFINMETERRYYVEKHKQENEEIIEKKVVIGKVLAFIPLCSVILIKLILPFVLEGMKQLSNTGL